VRWRLDKKTGKSSLETVFHLCTQPPGARGQAAWGRVIRSHWRIENCNHWRRDACLREDHTPGRDPRIIGNLAVARAALLFYNEHVGTGNINQTVQKNQSGKNNTIRWMMAQNPFK